MANPLARAWYMVRNRWWFWNDKRRFSGAPHPYAQGPNLERYMAALRTAGMTFSVGENELPPGSTEYEDALKDFAQSVPPTRQLKKLIHA